jgi:hypothetical protein
VELLSHHSETGAKRCSTCAINYPLFIEVCRVCGEETWTMYVTSPQEDWEEVVAEMLGADTPPAESVYFHPHDALCRVSFRSTRLWIAHADLLAVGYYALEDGSIVFVNGRFYELEGFDRLNKEWWVDEIETEGAADNLHPSMFERLDGFDRG